VEVRVVNVVDLMRLETPSEHPHGMSDAEFDALFTKDKPVIFAYHGYPWLMSCSPTAPAHRKAGNLASGPVHGSLETIASHTLGLAQ
jgi:phosphoketolase